MRERVEDLGRIYEKLNNLFQYDIFRRTFIRPKDFVWWFREQNEEDQDILLRTFIYGTEELKEEIYNIMDIAIGGDDDEEDL